MAMWHFGNQTLAAWTAAAEASEVCLGPGLVNEYKPVRIEADHLDLPLRTPQLDIWAILLGSVKDFFLKVICSAEAPAK